MSAAKHSSRIPLATRFAAWAFRGIVRMWPADTRDWARGMQSELTDITDARESLRWLQGGVMSLTKAWWNRALFGAKSGERRPLKLPGIGAIAFLLLAIISLALPGMRQGLTAVVQTWQSSRGGLSDSELRALGAQAERTHDAKLLAFVAMRLEPDSSDRLRWADLAVSLDPSLTWIYFQMDHFYLPEYQLTEAEFAPRAARLQQWDSSNSVVYLMQADRLVDSAKWNYGYSDFGGKYEFSDAAVAFAKSNPKWAELMDKAFRAPRFDDYSRRRFELSLAVTREHNLNQLDLTFSVFSSRLPDLFKLHLYSSAMLREGAILEAAGDSSAIQKYWLAANFAQRMKLGDGEETIERWSSLGMIQRSFTKLQALLEKQGRTEEANYAQYEAQSATSEIQALRANNFQTGWNQRTALWTGLMIHTSALLMITAASLTLIALLWIGITYRSDSRSMGRRWLCATGRYSPVLLVFSIVLFYSNYFPYVTSFRDASPDNLLRLTRTYSLMLDMPNMISGGTNIHGAFIFWSAITVVGVGIAAIMLVRMALRDRFDKQAAA